MAEKQCVRQNLDESRIRDHNWSLFQRVSIDVLTGLSAAVAVAPIMTIIDRAVIEATAGHTSVLISAKASVSSIVRHPVRWIRNRPFGLMLLLYSGTYMTANIIDTASSDTQGLPANSVTSSWTKFATVSTVNVGLSVYKDSQFARTFGVVSARSLPMASYIPFFLRDGLTILGTFNLPQLIAPSLPSTMDSVVSRLSIAQFATPAVMQVFATPLHLLGLDLYNRHGRMGWRSRLNRIGSTCAPATFARMCRIIPAYGLGGVVNTTMRSRLMSSPD